MITGSEVKQILEHLERQTQLLEIIAVALSQEEPAPESDVCQHPEDHRVSFATPMEPDHWICNACKYEHRGVIHN